MNIKTRHNALALVLAGGRGLRMGILSIPRPKPCLPFAGSYRIIDFVLSNCAHSGIEKVAILADYQRCVLTRYLSEWHKSTHFWRSMDVLIPRGVSFAGTADAVFQNTDYIRACNAPSVLILAGDHIYKMNYRPMIALHEASGADVTVAVAPMPADQAHRFGIVGVDSSGRITDFVEKPARPSGNLVSMGIYVFKQEALLRSLAKDAVAVGSVHDFGYSVIPQMVGEGNSFAYRYDDYWQDVGTIESYYQTNIAMARGELPFSMEGDWKVVTRAARFPRIRKHGHASIKSSLVGPGCLVKGEVENSVLSPGVVVEHNAVVRNSVIMAKSVIDQHSIVNEAVLDEGVHVGRACVVGSLGGGALKEKGITVVGKGVIIPKSTVIPRNCTVVPTEAAVRAAHCPDGRQDVVVVDGGSVRKF